MIQTKLLLCKSGRAANYEMYDVRIGSCKGYIMYAENAHDSAMELVCTDEESAQTAFEHICGGELSPLHLCDVARDLRECELVR